jgi:hypothetical protein
MQEQLRDLENNRPDFSEENRLLTHTGMAHPEGGRQSSLIRVEDVRKIEQCKYTQLA